MKKHVLFLTVFLLALNVSFATIRTVYNGPNPPSGSYSTIGAAHSAAAVGDTLYVQPTAFYYDITTITKRLVIIGSGYAPQKVNSVWTLYNTLTFSSSASGSTIMGGWAISIHLQAATNNITLSRLYFPGQSLHLYGTTSINNTTVNECYFQQGAVNFGPDNNNTYIINNLIFNNCVFLGHNNTTQPIFWNAGNINCTSVLTNVNFNNCLFYGWNSGSNTTSPFNESSWPYNFNSCIFNKINMNVSNSTFTNCLTYSCNNNNIWDISGNTNSNVAGTNLANQDPLFNNGVQSQGISLAHDYFSVQGSSPTLKTNHAGALYDIGPYGGSGVFTFGNANTSPLPLVHTMSIATPSLQSGQNITIDITGKRRN